MGLNVELFFTRAATANDVGKVIRDWFSSPPGTEGRQPDWGLPSSYDAQLWSERKRKVALAPPTGGWVAAIESKEVLDFGLLQRLSEVLKTTVIAVQLSEVSGCCGSALCEKGAVVEHYFSEEDDDPAGVVAAVLLRNSVAARLLTFRDAVQRRDDGWILIGP